MTPDSTKDIPDADQSKYWTPRKIFGSGKPSPSSTLSPPPPPEPGEYPKKPKYWQLRGTEHARGLNRIAFWGTVIMTGVSALFYFFSDFTERYDKRFQPNAPRDQKDKVKTM